MFIATPHHQVIAIDGKTALQLWRYTKEVAEDAIGGPEKKCGRQRWKRTGTAIT
jgi:glucose dehydrogenase